MKFSCLHSQKSAIGLDRTGTKPVTLSPSETLSFSFAARTSPFLQEPPDNRSCTMTEELSSHMHWKWHSSLKKKKKKNPILLFNHLSSLSLKKTQKTGGKGLTYKVWNRLFLLYSFLHKIMSLIAVKVSR